MQTGSQGYSTKSAMKVRGQGRDWLGGVTLELERSKDAGLLWEEGWLRPCGKAKQTTLQSVVGQQAHYWGIWVTGDLLRAEKVLCSQREVSFDNSKS